MGQTPNHCRIEARYLRGGDLWGRALLAAGLTIASVSVLFSGRFGLVVMTLAAIGALFCGGVTLSAFGKLLDRSPALIIDAKGLVYPSVSDELLPWRDFESISRTKHGGREWWTLRLTPVATRRFLRNGFWNWIARCDRRLPQEIFLPAMPLGIDTARLVEIIATRIETARGAENVGTAASIIDDAPPYRKLGRTLSAIIRNPGYVLFCVVVGATLLSGSPEEIYGAVLAVGAGVVVQLAQSHFVKSDISESGR
ncbi:hypothetical protein [Methylosinus sp. PW1]|uniref:hypothetical protein n=1 Tax=Methylosinus sp. PW1 TaxID=107636 RepID=UPI000563F96E|nr:hypothetical protein [Methylosinus sp. PW1]